MMINGPSICQHKIILDEIQNIEIKTIKVLLSKQFYKNKDNSEVSETHKDKKGKYLEWTIKPDNVYGKQQIDIDCSVCHSEDNFNRGHLIADSIIGYCDEFDYRKREDFVMITNWCNRANTNHKNRKACGMFYFENVILNTLEKGIDVEYRVTPIFKKNSEGAEQEFEYLPRGVILEAKTPNKEAFEVEDDDIIMNEFNVFIPNTQNGLDINYKTGSIKATSSLTEANASHADPIKKLPEHIIKDALSTIATYPKVEEQANLSRIAAATSLLKNKEIAQLPKKIDSMIEQSDLKRVLEQNKELFKSLNKMSQILGQSIATDYLVELRRQLSNLSEVVKNALTPYTEEERKRIIAKVESFADKGWVIFFQNRAVVNQLLLDDTEGIEVEWLDNLKEIIADTSNIEFLAKSQCFSYHLIQSMAMSYSEQNYYAAYTLASLAIDGALNRLAEPLSSDADRMTAVGHRAIKKIDNQISPVEKTVFDYGLLHWCYNFFADTQRFTINYPSRHMIGHGRWDDEISEEEFLKLFNVLLYLEDNFDYWAGIVDENC
ncbi:DNA/RNA non-specific endonuclease [Streptococcus ruminantium]|uniref:DNA/RNA non-specific endonuclease n=1 Tax=Streptococcus ruminantium TaxID=1917441 RepID=UPI000C1A461D|nr:DNA/RNA non-specific endonuclease [Streptococcus ruminantium]MDQ8821270.1 DNA/RNA non-specific endonuclease [Streptococcus ruminantium]MDQ8837658.1 DNA/RNA non-specific endonuclease [Streptococcus ruminantium]